MAKRRAKVEDTTPKETEQVAPEATVETPEVIPEVKEEVKVEVPETKVGAPKVKKEVKTPATKVVSLEDFIAKAKEDTGLKAVANSIERYIKVVYGTHATNGDMVANMSHELFVTINNVMSIADYKTFKKQFDFINKLFLLGANGKFSPVALSRYDFHWSFGTDERHRYIQLVEFLTAMADVNKRKSTLARINTDTVTNTLPKDAVKNVVRYYNM